MAAAGTEFLLVQLAALFLLAKVGGYLASLVRIPPLVGEVVAGVAVANTMLNDTLQIAGSDDLLFLFAELGVVFLIFTVGLETDLKELLKVGGTAAWTAILGIVIPFGAGLGLFLALGHTMTASLFLGVAMVATSVGITARVLAEMGALQSKPARIILGAAVIDDVLGLLLLTLVSVIAVQGAVSPGEVGVILLTTGAFFVVAILLGLGTLSVTMRGVRTGSGGPMTAYLRRPDFLIALAIGLCLALSALAVEFGMAAIIGAFVAGLLITAGTGGTPSGAHGESGIEHGMETITQFLSPFFFIYIGLQVDIAVLGSTAWLILGVTLLAIVTKLVGCAIGSWGEGKDTALAVGLGMTPRGEVGIIVALLGLQLGIVGQEVYGVVVMMSVLTTVIAPPLLTWAMRRVEDAEIGEPEPVGHLG